MKEILFQEVWIMKRNIKYLLILFIVLHSHSTINCNSSDDNNIPSNGNNHQVLPERVIWDYKTANLTFYSSPAIDHENNIYIGSHDCSGDYIPNYITYLYSIDDFGREKWTLLTGGCSNSAPSIGSDNRIYLVTSAEGIYSIRQDGTEEWKIESDTFLNVATSPAISTDRTLYVSFGSDGLFAINADGIEIWNLNTDLANLTTTVIDIQENIFFGANSNSQGKFFAIDKEGLLLWEININDAYLSSPSIGNDGTIYFSSGLESRLYAVNPTGQIKWEFDLETSEDFQNIGFPIPPVIDEEENIYLGSTSSTFYAINSNGSKRWEFTADSYITSSAVIGEGNIIYFGDLESNIYALDTNGTLQWKIKIPYDAISWSFPVMDCNGILYLGYYPQGMFGDSGILAIQTNSLGPANSPWPMYGHDPQHTGNQATPICQ